MRFKANIIRNLWAHLPLRIVFLALIWLVLITMLHLSMNFEEEERKVVQMGYMPVITNLAAPLLDQASLQADADIRFKAIKFASFAEMAEALRHNEIQAAFIIAPLSIVLRQQGEDVKVVYIGNRHESTMVVRKDIQAKSLKDLTGRTVAVPMRYSGHNLGILELVADAGLEKHIRIVEMNPPDMGSALAAGSLDAYFVGEPFAAQTLKADIADLFFYVEDIWPDFICNLLLVKQDFIAEHTDLVQTLVQSAARSGIWAKQHPARSAQIASQYWGQSLELVQYALNTPAQRIVFNRFVPIETEMQKMANMMKRFGLIEKADIEGLVEDRFARQADLNGITDLQSILLPPQ